MSAQNQTTVNSKTVAKALRLWFKAMPAFTACDRGQQLKKLRSSGFDALERFLISQARLFGIDERPLSRFLHIPESQKLVTPARRVVEKILEQSVLQLGSASTAGPAPSSDKQGEAEPTDTKRIACLIVGGQDSGDTTSPMPRLIEREGYSFLADFSWVRWNGEEHNFNKRQAKAIGLLACAYQKDGHSLDEKMIAEHLDSEPENFRLNKLFLRHAALNKMILKVRPGRYSLNGPRTIPDE